MADRVDKRWSDKGLDQYPLEAILGTLAHYGVSVDEAGYRALAKDTFPLFIAAKWHEDGWKGTGQFSRFPAAASEELWRRFFPGEATPADVALGIINLLETLDGVLEGKADDGTLDTRFKVVEAYAPKLPADAARREAFLEELAGCLGEWLDAFDEMPFELVKAGHPALADRFAGVEVALYPEQRGIPEALVQAAKGDEAPAVQALLSITGDAARTPLARLAAVDALLDLERADEAKAPLLALLDELVAAKDLDLVSAGLERLLALAEEAPDEAARAALREKVDEYADRLGLLEARGDE